MRGSELNEECLTVAEYYVTLYYVPQHMRSKHFL